MMGKVGKKYEPKDKVGLGGGTAQLATPSSGESSSLKLEMEPGT